MRNSPTSCNRLLFRNGGTKGSETPTIVMTKPVPAGAQKLAVLADVSASLLVLNPPRGDVIELYLRLKSASSVPARPERYTAEIQLANGKKLTARSTRDDAIHPLYTAL